jgi:hypothetical protein
VSVTVTNLLWGDGRDPGESLARQLRKADVSSKALAASPSADPRAYPVLDGRISEVLRGGVEVDLGSMVIAAWTGYQHLRDAATRTCDGGPPEDVVLAEHEITSTHQPVVDILVNGARVETLTFDLVLSLILRSVIAVVHGGKLVALRGGEVAAEARLELRGTVLAKGERPCLAGVLVQLGDGVQLVSPGSAVPSPAPAAPRSTPSTPAAPSPAPATPAWVGEVAAAASNPVPSQAEVLWWDRAAAAAPAPADSPGPAASWWKQVQGGQQ